MITSSMYVAEVDEELSRKDNEIHRLQEIIRELQTVASGGHGGSPTVLTTVGMTGTHPVHCKAPPVDPVTG